MFSSSDPLTLPDPPNPRDVQRRVDEINKRIDMITDIVSSLPNEDKAYYNARIKCLVMKKQKMITLATFAQTQGMQRLIADMDILVAESDLVADVEAIRREIKSQISKEPIFSGPARTLELLDDSNDTVIVECIPSHSTPLREETPPFNKIGQLTSEQKLHTVDTTCTKSQDTNQSPSSIPDGVIKPDKYNQNLKTEKSSSTMKKEKHTEKSRAEIAVPQTAEIQPEKETVPWKIHQIDTTMLKFHLTKDRIPVESKHPRKETLSTSNRQKDPRKETKQEEFANKPNKSKTSSRAHSQKSVEKNAVETDLTTTTKSFPELKVLDKEKPCTVNKPNAKDTSCQKNKDSNKTLPVESYRDVMLLNNNLQKLYTPNIASNDITKSTKVEEKTTKNTETCKTSTTNSKNSDMSRKTHDSLLSESSTSSSKRSCDSPDTSAKRRKLSHNSHDIQKDKKSHEHKHSTRTYEKTHEHLESNKKDAKSKDYSKYSTKKDKSLFSDALNNIKKAQDSLQSNNHIEKDIKNEEETRIKKHKRSHRSSESSKRKSHKTDKHTEKVRKSDTKTECNTSHVGSLRNIVDIQNVNNNNMGDEKAISNMNKLVNRSMEKNVQDTHSQDDIVNVLFRDLMGAKMIKIEFESTTENTTTCYECGPVSEDHMCVYTLRELLESC